MKVFFRTIHLYLSLVAGLVVAVVCLTGAGLVFEKELEQAWHPARYFVPAATAPRLPLARLVAAVQAARPQARINSLKVYADPTRTVEVSLAGQPAAAGRPQTKPKGSKEREGRGPVVFMNPYTAAITGELNYRETIFFQLMAVHRGMVGGPAGKLVVGVSTVLLLVILLTGVVLWWPATRKALRQRLRVKWRGGWKRLNHDLHIVLGFYAALFLLVFAFTGLAWSFEWFNKGIYALANSPLERPEPPVSAPLAGPAPSLGPDAALARARRRAPRAVFYALQLPQHATGSLRVTTLRPGAAHDNATDDLYLDQYRGTVLATQAYEQRSAGQRARGWFKPVHTGAVFGWPSRVVALVTCLLGFTFPITGTLLWLNRLRKARHQQRRVLARA